MLVKFTTAKPGRPNWNVAVQRAMVVITDATVKGEDTRIPELLVKVCPDVPVRYYPTLRSDAEAEIKRLTEEHSTGIFVELEQLRSSHAY